MSRIGRRPVPVPSGVTVTLKDGEVSVKGPKGTLVERAPAGIAIEVADGQVRFTRPDDQTPTRALHGLARASVANMITGVTQGFVRELEIQGVGYRAAMRGTALELNVGFSHSVVVDAPAGITFDVPTPSEIVVKGIDKQQVGEIAAEVRDVRPPEPYKGKGIRYRGEYVRRKVGKRA